MFESDVFNWSAISKCKTQLYGFAILWIMLLHGLVRGAKASLGNHLSFLTPLITHGQYGVEIFLFLSGIYLYFSLKKNCNFSEFYKKRLIRILVPYLAITGTYWFVLCVCIKHNVIRFIGNITQYTFWFGHVHFAWYIGAILLFYFIYPFIFKYLLAGRSNRFSFGSILILTIIVYALCFLLKHSGSGTITDWYKEVEIALTRLPDFLWGCYCGKLVYGKRQISKLTLAIASIFFIGGIALMYMNDVYMSFYRIPGLIFAISFCILFPPILSSLDIPRLNQALSWLGKVSLELYLFHLVAQNTTVFLHLYGHSKTGNYVRYLMYCVLGSVVVIWVLKPLLDKLSNRIRASILHNEFKGECKCE